MSVDWIELDLKKGKVASCCQYDDELSGAIIFEELLDQQESCSFRRKNLLSGISRISSEIGRWVGG